MSRASCSDSSTYCFSCSGEAVTGSIDLSGFGRDSETGDGGFDVDSETGDLTD